MTDQGLILLGLFAVVGIIFGLALYQGKREAEEYERQIRKVNRRDEGDDDQD